MRITIVDDRPSDLLLLKTILDDLGYPQYTSCIGYDQAIASLTQEECDLLITDFSLDKDKSAIDVILDSDLPASTGVIVVTNYYKEAIYEKFKNVRPVLFLQKGFSPLELRQAIEFQVNSTKTKSVDIQDKFYVKIGDKLEIVNTLDIDYFEADGKYSNVYVGKHKYSVRATIIGLLKVLPSNFLRIHGSYIINLNKVKTIIPVENVVELEEHTLPFSRNYKKDLLDQFHFI